MGTKSTAKDITDMRFGRLLVIKRNGINKHRNAMWLCICDCGKYSTVAGRALRSGNTKSCGCGVVDSAREVMSKRALPQQIAAERTVYGTYKSAAIKRGYCFDLTVETFILLSSKNCFYCGKPPEIRTIKRSGRKSKPLTFSLNGIDRLDNTKGYIIDNCVPCCYECNRSKGTRTVEEYIDHCRRVVEKFL